MCKLSHILAVKKHNSAITVVSKHQKEANGALDFSTSP